MAGLDDLSRGELADILRRLRILETASPLQNASIGEDGLRVYNGGVITIENGGLNVTGTATIHGVLNADGTINFTGPVTISGPLTVSGTTNITGDTTVTGDFTTNGPLHVNGTTDIAGDTTVTGDFDVNGPMKTTGTLSVEGVTTLKSDLNVTTGGKIKVGSNMTLTPSAYGGSVEFGQGGTLSSTASGIRMGSGSAGVSVNGSSVNITSSGDGTIVVGPSVTDVYGLLRANFGLETVGPKNFVMPHPNKPGWVLRHGATESPISGVEYFGEGVLDDSGECIVSLPEYFESLVKEGGRSVYVAGRGFSATWGAVEDGRFEVSGPASGAFSWLVKGERTSGDFVAEEPDPRASED